MTLEETTQSSQSFFQEYDTKKYYNTMYIWEYKEKQKKVPEVIYPKKSVCLKLGFEKL